MPSTNSISFHHHTRPPPHGGRAAEPARRRHAHGRRVVQHDGSRARVGTLGGAVSAHVDELAGVRAILPAAVAHAPRRRAHARAARRLGDFARYLEWLYEQPVAALAAEIAQHSQARPLNSMHREARHALSGSLLREFNRSAPHTFQQWSDMPAMAAFCATNAAKRSNAGLVGAHCTRAWHVGTAGDSETQAWRPNCTVHALADGGGRGFLQVLMSAERERDPDRSREGSKDAPAPLGSGTPAQRWAAAWRWRAGAPLAPPQTGRWRREDVDIGPCVWRTCRARA